MPDAREAVMPGTRRRSRARLAWGVVAYAILQTGLLVVMSADPKVRDPQYGLRLFELRARQREHPGRPLVLLLGSSRVAVNVDTDALAARHPSGPLVFNFGITGSKSVDELVTLHRLFAAGVRPDCVLVDAHFTEYRPPPPDPPPDYRRYDWSDVGVLKRHSDTPAALEQYRLSSHLAPWYTHRLQLQVEWAPDLAPEGTRGIANGWKTITPWGFLRLTSLDVREADRPYNLQRVAETRRVMLARSEDGAVSDHSRAAFREMKELCDRHGCRMALLHTPDIYLWDYSEPARARIEAELGELAAGLGVPRLDFRRWGGVAESYDGVHLTQEGADRFTADFAPHVLRLAGDPSAGAVVWQPPPLVEWGKGFSIEETSDIPGWRRFRWCDSEGTLTLVNRTDSTRRLTVTFSPQSFAAGPCDLTIDWLGKSEALKIVSGPTQVRRQIDLPPGSHHMRFKCDGPATVYPTRTVVFALHEFTLTLDDGG